MSKSLAFYVNTQTSPDKVFEALLNVSKWWGFQDLAGQSLALHDSFTITHPGTHYSKQVVTEFVPGKRLVWSITECLMPWLRNTEEWTGTRLIFELQNGKLHFTHEGLTPEKECYTRVSEGWREILEINFLNYLQKHKIRTCYQIGIDLDKTDAQVFKSICNAGEWWPEDMVGRADALDEVFIFKSDESHFSKNKVVEFVQNRKITWLTIESRRGRDNFDWSGTRFIFELAPKGDGCALCFTYDGWVLESEETRLHEICDYTIKEALVQFSG